MHFGYDRASKPDIMALRPIPGRYIANALESPSSAMPQRINDRDLFAVQVTKVTHNAGASWVRRRPPPSDPPLSGSVTYGCERRVGAR